MRCKCWLAVLLSAAVSYGLTSVFHVNPVKASWSGWTAQDFYVSEVVTLNVDSLGPPGYCELFSGQGGGEEFLVNVYSYPNGIVALASGQGTESRDNVWVRCTLTVAHPESLIKGRRYEFRWSRANGARIQYYYNYCATRYDSVTWTEELDCGPGRLRIA
jgi:hypothetical protein